MTLSLIPRPFLRFGSLAALTIALFGGATPARADNPLVQHAYTADPAPLVSGDTVYLYTSHDEDVTIDNFFTMNDWFVFSSKDMVNWTDHGSPLGFQSFSWATGKAWAPHAIERDGLFYLYVPVSDSIGVAVSDSPIGPFEDAIGAPLLANYQYIDPTVFIDDDDQAYLYFGNPRLWYVELNDDMISYTGQVQQIPNTAESFGQRDGNVEDRPTLYEEGPWFYKRNDLYYMMYAASGIPEDIAYSTSPGPTGPWTYQGIIMQNEGGHAFTNHAGVVDFKDRSYFFYHTQELPGGGGFKRSVALEEFSYEADGSFPTISKTSEGPDAAESLNPFLRTEGETIAWGSGVEVEDCDAGGRNVSGIENGDSIKIKQVDFLTGALTFEASVASAGSGGSIELHLDAAGGPLIGTCAVTPTGGWQTWESVSCDVEGAEGVHDLFLVFTGGGGTLFNLDFWQFTPTDPLVLGTGGASGAGGAGDTGGSNAGGAATGGSSAGGGDNSGGSLSPGIGGAGWNISTGGTPATTTGGTGGVPTMSAGGTTSVDGNPGDAGPPSDSGGCSLVPTPEAPRGLGAWMILGATFVLSRVRRRRLTRLSRKAGF